MRFNNFLQSTLEIEERNARYYHGEIGYMLGHNQLSDLTHNEVKPTLLVMKTIDVESGNDTKLISLGEVRVPDSVDWRKRTSLPASR